MKWMGNRQSSNVEDRRGMSATGKTLVGGGLIGVIILVVQLFMGDEGSGVVNQLEKQLNQQTATSESSRELTAEEKELGDFVKTVFGYTEDTWHSIFQNLNRTYQEPGMVLFTDAVETGCGPASSAAGPFYCPSDHKVYMDLSFFEELRNRFGAEGGDFAIAYVIAHEVGHHVQTLLGTSSKVRELQQRESKTGANKLSVALELQADFYAGLWAHHNKQYLEAGDIEEAMSAANAVGDDAIQKRIQGHVVPDSFTHGSSKQRIYWFMKGYNSGDINQSDTFSTIN